MNVASIDYCKELYKLSGWVDVSKLYFNSMAGWIVQPEDDVRESIKALKQEPNDWLPAYDLGFLMRKLPQGVILSSSSDSDGPFWEASFLPFGLSWVAESADTPDDAVCKLAIELFNQGILTKAQS